MRKELEIGDEIVIYPEKGHTYLSPKVRNGSKDQKFDSSKLPGELIAVYIGKEYKKGILYDKYTLKAIPRELRNIYLNEENGFANAGKELNSVARILQGKAYDGRELEYVRSIKIEDVNTIFKVFPDLEQQKVYQLGRENVNINRMKSFGNILSIADNFPRDKEANVIRSYVKDKYIIESTAYCYYAKDILTEEKRKELIFLQRPYYLNSTGVYARPISYRVSSYVNFAIGAVQKGGVYQGGEGIYTIKQYSFYYPIYFAVRPVFYLKSYIQNDIGKERQKEEILKEIKNQQETILIMKENLSQKEKELERMIEEALKLV